MNRILGIDYGTKKIGIALASGEFVRPLAILDNKPGHLLEEQAIQSIIQTAHEESVQTIVIGIPLIKGKETKASSAVRQFGRRIQHLAGEKIQITHIDEFYTSKDAKETSTRDDISRRKRKEDHALAACEIVKRYITASER